MRRRSVFTGHLKKIQTNKKQHQHKTKTKIKQNKIFQDYFPRTDLQYFPSFLHQVHINTNPKNLII